MEKQKNAGRKSSEDIIKTLAEYRRQQVINWLKEKWSKSQRCPICGHSEWSIGGTIHELREFHNGSFVVGGSVFPVAPIVCSFCGYTVFFNAFKLGLVEYPMKEGGEKNG